MRQENPALKRVLALEGVTAQLNDWKNSGVEPRAEYMSAIYSQLRAIAGNLFRNERGGHSLQPTEVINEAYLKMMKPGKAPWKDRVHFLAIAAGAMRQVLVDHARARLAAKRGRGEPALELKEDIALRAGETAGPDILIIDEALNRLAKLDTRKARIVELRFFSGMTIDETAKALGIGRSAAVEQWAMARAWLKQELNAHDASRVEEDRSNLQESDAAPRTAKERLRRKGLSRRRGVAQPGGVAPGRA